MDKAELEIGFGDFEHLGASLFAFSARLEICKGHITKSSGDKPRRTIFVPID
jgi:hypothetical protein